MVVVVGLGDYGIRLASRPAKFSTKHGQSRTNEQRKHLSSLPPSLPFSSALITVGIGITLSIHLAIIVRRVGCLLLGAGQSQGLTHSRTQPPRHSFPPDTANTTPSLPRHNPHTPTQCRYSSLVRRHGLLKSTTQRPRTPPPQSPSTPG